MASNVKLSAWRTKLTLQERNMMPAPFCNACSIPVDIGPEALEVRVESGKTLALVAYSCGCLPVGRTRDEWVKEAEQQGCTIG